MGGEIDTAFVDISLRLDSLDQSLREMEGRVTDSATRAGQQGGEGFKGAMGQAFGGLATLAATAATAAAAAVAAGVVGAAKLSLDIAQQANQGVQDMQAQLGVTEQQAVALGETAKRVFADNWGGSLKEAQDMVVQVRRQMKSLSDEELETATKKAAALADTFGTDVGEQAQAAESLMKNFGLTSDQAFDFIAKGFQKGLNNSGDFLDTINEYSTQFKNGGASAGQFFSIIETGSQGGVLGTDKAADAFKEFVVRIQDGSKTTSQGLEALGIDSEALAAKMASGQMTAAQAFDLVTGKLRGLKDDNARMQAGVALLGTQFEDLGKSGALGIDTTKTKMADLAGATAQVQQRYNNFGQLAQGAWRQFLLALEPVGQELLKLANQAMPVISQALKDLGPVVTSMVKGAVAAFQQFSQQAGPVLSQGVGTIRGIVSTIGPAISQGIAIAKSVFSTLAPYIVTIIQGLAPVVQSLGPLFRATFTVVGQLWAQVLKPALDAFLPVFQAVFGAVAAVVKAAIGIVTGVLQTISAFMRGDVSGAAHALNGAFDRAASGIGEAMRRGAALVMQALGNLPARMTEIAGQIIAGLVNGIRNGASQIGKAAADMAGNAVSSVKNFLGIRSPSRVMQSLGEFTAQGFVNGIASRNDTVKQAATNTAKTFLDAFKDLKLERQMGNVDLSAYTSTLQQAAAALRSKLGTVKEGTPAYTEWLKALSTVQAELDRLAAAAKKTEGSAADLAAEMKKGRQEIAQTEAQERYVEGLRKATAAQLAHALAVARTSGDVEKYSAIRAEQQRREDAVAAATKKSADAQAAAAKQVQDNIRQINGVEASDRYARMLDNATDAQLRNALAVAKSKGEVEKYNAIRAEMKEREDAATAATDKATAAARQHAEQLAANQKQIEDGLKFEAYVQGLSGYEDAQLAAARANALAAGDAQKFNAVLAEQKRRADEAADALRGLVDEQQKEAFARYQDAQAVNDNAYRQSYGAGDEGLVTALSALTGFTVEQVAGDVDAALADLERWNRSAADTVRRVYDDALKARKAANDATAAEVARAVQMADAARAQIVENTQAEAAAAQDAAITFDSLNGQIKELVSQGRDPRQTGFVDWLDELAAGSGRAAAAAIEVKQRLDALIMTAQGMDGVEDGGVVAARGTRTPAAPTSGLVEARGTRTPNVVAESTAARGALSEEAAAWQKRTQALEYSRAETEKYRESVKGLSLEELKHEQALALAGGQQAKYEVLTALITDRTKSATDATKLLADTQGEVDKALGKSEKPWQKQIDALLKAKGQSKELDAQIDALVGQLQHLQQQAGQQQGFDNLKNKIGQVGDIVGKVFAMFGADAEIQQGISQLTAGIQDGVEAFAKFASGDILGGIQAALSGIMNIGSAIENLDPGIKAWKKGLLEVAQIEKDMVGAKSYGNIKNPFYDALTQDAAAREKMGNSKWYQRLGWSIFGGAPQFMSEEAARFMARSAQIFGEVAEGLQGGIESALMNAFETGDWTGAEEAMEKSLNSLVAKMALQAIVAASNLESKIKAYAEARNRALEDGVIDPAEQAQLDQYIADIKAEQKRIAQEWRSTAETLPGYGQGKPKEAPAPQDAPPQATTPLDINRTVQVNMPSITASVNLDVLGTLAGVVERAAPRIEAGGQGIVEGMNHLHAVVNQLQQFVDGLRMSPDGSYR